MKKKGLTSFHSRWYVGVTGPPSPPPVSSTRKLCGGLALLDSSPHSGKSSKFSTPPDTRKESRHFCFIVEKNSRFCPLPWPPRYPCHSPLCTNMCNAHIYVDIVGPLPPSQGFAHIFTMIDRTTRGAEAVPLSSITASACADSLCSTWIARFGVAHTNHIRQRHTIHFCTLVSPHFFPAKKRILFMIKAQSLLFENF
jgi:hypothetical protein